MRRSIHYAAALAVALLAMGCEQSDNNEVVTKLKDLDKRQKAMDAKIDKLLAGGGAAGAPHPRGAAGQQPGGRPPGPDPAEVYAVPVAGSPYKGAEHAKVTIVEAFEFA